MAKITGGVVTYALSRSVNFQTVKFEQSLAYTLDHDDDEKQVRDEILDTLRNTAAAIVGNDLQYYAELSEQSHQARSNGRGARGPNR